MNSIKNCRKSFDGEGIFLNYKKWLVSHGDKELAATIAEKYNLDPLEALLLVSRGVSDEESVLAFFSDCAALSDPFEIKDMDKAVQRINKAVDSFERIAIFGDYDADGVTATAVVYSYLSAMGADVIYRIPDRCDDGYGLNNDGINELHKLGTKLIVTVDNGISAIEQAQLCKKLGIDLIVTDHHVAGDKLPDCVAVVNPHRKDCGSRFKDFAGVGVAFKLICALDGDGNKILEEFADLIALGTIADIVSLLGENRVIVKKGIELINKSCRVGIDALKQVSGVFDKKITSDSVAFILAPRINAAGRMGSAERALRLLLSEDEDEALQLASEINRANSERRSSEQEVMRQIEEKFFENPGLCYDRIIVVDGDGWQPGIIGIVAARIVEKYNRPAIVITNCEDESKGSGRSICGFSLYDALQSTQDILNRFGGHALAAGLGLQKENIERFRKKINEYAAGIEMPPASLKLDCKLNPAYVNKEILKILKRLEPFGHNNRRPLFGLYGMTLDEITSASNGKHMRLVLSKGGVKITAMKFFEEFDKTPFAAGDKLDLAVTLSENEYGGETQVSVIIKDIKMSGEDEDGCILSARIFEKYKRSERMTDNELESAIPDREVIAKIYRFIRSNGGWFHSVKMLCYRLNDAICTPCKVGVSLDIMEDLGLIKAAQGAITLPEKITRVNLEDSGILKKLNEQRGERNACQGG